MTDKFEASFHPSGCHRPACLSAGDSEWFHHGHENSFQAEEFDAVSERLAFKVTPQLQQVAGQGLTGFSPAARIVMGLEGIEDSYLDFYSSPAGMRRMSDWLKVQAERLEAWEAQARQEFKEANGG